MPRQSKTASAEKQQPEVNAVLAQAAEMTASRLQPET
jgi:hypothetical protein